MKKILKIIKNNIFGFTIGLIVCSVIVVLADTISASLVTYDTSISHSNYNTVQGALDNLYDVSNNLYSMVPSSAGLRLVINGVPGLSSTLIDGLYRYQGPTADNYICFGTTNKTTCTGDTDKYMYRIIGVNSSGQMKLIKKEALNTDYAWDPTNSKEWSTCDLNAGLNGSYFLTDTNYVPNGWEDRIAMSDWHYGDVKNATVTGIASLELGFPTTQAKIGLWYLHDYADAYSSTPQYNTNSWIFLWSSQNDSSASTHWALGNEWFITRYGAGYTWNVTAGGGVEYNNSSTVRSSHTQHVRPVFFLTSSQVIASGSGTLDDPYILQ